jgi:hypothetical protein
MDDPPSLAELNHAHDTLPDEERLNLLEELLVACSLGWSQVVGVLEACVLDHEVWETLRGLPEV